VSGVTFGPRASEGVLWDKIPRERGVVADTHEIQMHSACFMLCLHLLVSVLVIL
jgi:hypothetical protein